MFTKYYRTGMALITGVLLLGVLLPFDSKEALSVPIMHRQQIGRGGPFIANRARVQRFSGKFYVSPEDASLPMKVILQNGEPDKRGFSWLRIFLGGDIAVEKLTRHEEPVANLLMDDNRVQRRTLNLDISHKVKPGVNTLIIEGKGPRGASLNWEVEAIGTNRSLAHTDSLR